MAKRTATKQLTQENWNDDDDEKETPGVYKTVDSSVLQNRVIKKAKRSLPQTYECAVPSRGVFSQFSGFGSKSVKSMDFSFVTNNCEKVSSQITNSDNREAKRNGSKSTTTEVESNISLLENSNESSLASKDSGSQYSLEKFEPRDMEYYKQLKALNESLYQWIRKHNEKNPWCDFTPVFEDYKKHLRLIDQKYPVKGKPSLVQTPKSVFKIPSAPVQRPSDMIIERKFGSGDSAQKLIKPEDSNSKTPDATELNEMYGAGFKSSTTNTSTFSFGIKSATTATVPSSNSGPTSSCGSSGKDKIANKRSSFTFGIAKSSEQVSPGKGQAENKKHSSFTFGVTKSAEHLSPGKDQASKKISTFTFSFTKSGDHLSDTTKLSSMLDSKPFSFAVTPLASSENSEGQSNNEAKEDDEYVPPKSEVVLIQEENAVYSKKCKLFYKKDDTYREMGVGMLYLKQNGKKTELLIRAGTVTGKILLNINLIASLPMQRMGKNNVLIVCVPNPPLSASSDNKESVSFLIRVKSTEDADELFDMLNKYKS